MRALDLFCGAGGVTRGLMNAGFEVWGIDIVKPSFYPGARFYCADARNIDPRWLAGAFMPLDLIWASPPCQAHTSLKAMHNAKRHDDLIGFTRKLLRASGVPYVIENVVGAPLENPVMLCGTMFGLATEGGAELQRHRIFEASFPLSAPCACRHSGGDVIGVYGGHYRNRKRGPHGARKPGEDRRNGERGLKDFTADDGRRAMGIDWMTGNELSQAIPPAFAEHIGRSFLAWRELVS